MADINPPQPQNDATSRGERPAIAEVFRMIWLVFGPVGALFTAATIWKLPPQTYSALDGVFWGIVALVVILRLVDIRVFHGTTTDDQPGTMTTWLSFTVKLLAVSTGVWFLAQWSQA